jgi:uncharacterized YccA/Bax inhibitor family protein
MNHAPAGPPADPAASAADATDAAGPSPAPARQRSWLEIRWRQFRRAPRPVVRAVTAGLVVAIVLGLPYLVYDIVLARGADLPGGDLRPLFLVLYVVLVLASGALITYLIVPQPSGGRSGSPRRSAWSAALGLMAAIPIAYLVLVLISQVLEPLLS